MGTILIACPACDVHCFAREDSCPSCGAALRRGDGSVVRTAAAVLMGLTLVTGAAACGDDAGSGGGSTEATGSGQGGFQAVSTYGVGPSSSDSSGSGGFGQGGTLGAGGLGGSGGTDFGGSGGAGGTGGGG